MRRGELYWVEFPPPVGRRPAVLVSRDEAYAVRSRVTVLPLTRTIRGIPTEVRLGRSDHVPRPCVANADELVTIPRDLLRERLGVLSEARLQELGAAIRFALGLEESTSAPRRRLR